MQNSPHYRPPFHPNQRVNYFPIGSRSRQNSPIVISVSPQRNGSQPRQLVQSLQNLQKIFQDQRENQFQSVSSQVQDRENSLNKSNQHYQQPPVNDQQYLTHPDQNGTKTKSYPLVPPFIEHSRQDLAESIVKQYSSRENKKDETISMSKTPRQQNSDKTKDMLSLPTTPQYQLNSEKQTKQPTSEEDIWKQRFYQVQETLGQKILDLKNEVQHKTRQNKENIEEKDSIIILKQKNNEILKENKLLKSRLEEKNLQIEQYRQTMKKMDQQLDAYEKSINNLQSRLRNSSDHSDFNVNQRKIEKQKQIISKLQGKNKKIKNLKKAIPQMEEMRIKLTNLLNIFNNDVEESDSSSITQISSIAYNSIISNNDHVPQGHLKKCKGIISPNAREQTTKELESMSVKQSLFIKSPKSSQVNLSEIIQKNLLNRKNKPN